MDDELRELGEVTTPSSCHHTAAGSGAPPPVGRQNISIQAVSAHLILNLFPAMLKKYFSEIRICESEGL